MAAARILPRAVPWPAPARARRSRLLTSWRFVGRAAPAPESCAAGAAAAPPPLPLLLGDVRVVLVAPKHEANVGAVARCCANFEAPHLVLVAPRFTASGSLAEARRLACGDAVLDRLVVVDALEDALADTNSSIGFTRRTGATRLTHVSLGHLLAEFPWALPLEPPATPAPEAAPLGTAPAQPHPAQQQQQPHEDAQRGAPGPSPSAATPITALVFGREESGLTEAELRLCSHACAIPTGRLQPSMNLSHAVGVVLSDLFSRRCGLLVASAALSSAPSCAPAAMPTSSAPATPAAPSTAAAAAAAAAATEEARPAEAPPAAAEAGGAVAGGPAAVPSEAPGSSLSAGGGGGATGGAGVNAGLLPASAREVELLIAKVAAVAEAVGVGGEEWVGGTGNHGRRRRPLGHVRSVISRAGVTRSESSALHGLTSAVLQALVPDHPLEAKKLVRGRRQQQQQPQEQEGAAHDAQPLLEDEQAGARPYAQATQLDAGGSVAAGEAPP